ncbi:hypothetical protein [Undibacterium sp. TS12]|uniref:hypothetical protein n=1 Tax=Undibacterium sp. TS12 TaxID=2908202 RepID=UPI001F4D28CC|nr:hypothetical protein [Undibacterium sp. TS12]MCH8618304.1 hypothetical protein [Undibacterium sp. TS12]
MHLPFDANLIRLGVAMHDAGKILHPQELEGPGSLHEPADEKMLLARGVDSAIARCRVTHAQWRQSGLSLEELSIALADKLWKGKREEQLEMLVIHAIAQKLQVDQWDLFTGLDDLFERIAAGGSDRLQRSRYPGSS